MLMGVREYARHRGVSHVAVIKAVRTGRIVTNDDGKIESAQADRDWVANTDFSRRSVGDDFEDNRQPALLESPAPAPASPEQIQLKAAQTGLAFGGTIQTCVTAAVVDDSDLDDDDIDALDRLQAMRVGEELPGQALQQQEPNKPAAGFESAGDLPGASVEHKDEEDPAVEYRRQRAERERLTVLKQRTEYDRLIGRLIEKEWAIECASTVFRSLRDAFLNMPARLRDTLAAEIDPDAVEQMLEAEVRACLQAVNVASMFAVDDSEEADK
jgi:hypothetical protein